jgi:hypothetical protein
MMFTVLRTLRRKTREVPLPSKAASTVAANVCRRQAIAAAANGSCMQSLPATAGCLVLA